MHHARDVLDALAVLLEPFLVDAGAVERLDELEHQAGLDLALRPEHREGDVLAAQVRVVQLRWHVLVHVPRSPAKRVVEVLHRRVEVMDDHRDL